MGNKKINILHPNDGELAQMIDRRTAEGFQIEQLENEEGFKVLDPDGQEVGKIPLDSSKEPYEIKQDLLDGLKGIFIPEGTELNKVDKPLSKEELEEHKKIREDINEHIKNKTLPRLFNPDPIKMVT